MTLSSLMSKVDIMSKPVLTVETLREEARKFALAESAHPEPTIYGVTDGKAIGTYLEHKFQQHLESRYVHAPGNSAMGIDLLSLTGHKYYGPKGAGALYVRRRKPKLRLACQIDGGGHENGLRSGTLNVPGLVGLGRAAEICRDEMTDESARLGGPPFAEITPEPHRPTGRRSRSPSPGIAAQRIAPPGSTHTRSIAPGAARTPQAMCAPSYTGPVAQEAAVSTPFFASTISPLVPMSTSRLLPR